MERIIEKKLKFSLATDDNYGIIKSTKEVIMAKVIIELEFDASNGRKVLNCDVYDYLEELIEDESLDYKVYDGDKTYGVLDYKGI